VEGDDAEESLKIFSPGRAYQLAALQIEDKGSDA